MSEIPTSPDSTERFSDRVADYVRFRPGYPDGMLDALATETALTAGSAIADIGSGTGISTELLLRLGGTVYAVEPNAMMRAAAEQHLGHSPGFRSIDGRAEDTTLPARSVDLVTVGQAFHWFDSDTARREFGRILREEGRVAIFWNSRLEDATPFLHDYEALLRTYGTDYEEINHRNLDPVRLGAFFMGGHRRQVFENQQTFDFAGLLGRLLSSSYAPLPGHPRHEPMLKALRDLFDAHNEGGTVRFLYETELYVGTLFESAGRPLS